LIETKTALEERNRVLQENEKLLRAKITDLNRKCSKISLLKLMRELEHVDAAKKPDLNKFMTVLESCDGEAIETIQQEISAFRERAQTNGWLGKQSGAGGGCEATGEGNRGTKRPAAADDNKFEQECKRLRIENLRLKKVALNEIKQS